MFDVAIVESMADDIALTLARMADQDRELNYALMTERVGNRVIIGPYTINQYPTHDDTRRFTVEKSGRVIFEELALYDVARKIVRLLIDGSYPESPVIKTLVQLNDEYLRSSHDECHFRIRAHSYHKSEQYERAFVVETRLQESRHKTTRLLHDLKKSSQ